MKIGTVTLIDPAISSLTPFPHRGFTANVQLSAIAGGDTYAEVLSVDEGDVAVNAQIWQADDLTARAVLDALIDYLKSGTQPVPVLYDDHSLGRIITDAGMTAASMTLSSATAAFVAGAVSTGGDVGRRVAIKGAGLQGDDLQSTITTVLSATSAALADAASSTVAGRLAVLAGGNYDGLYTISRAVPAFDTGYPGRIPVALTMRRAY